MRFYFYTLKIYNSMIKIINEKICLVLPQNTFISTIGNPYFNKDRILCYPPYITIVKKECVLEIDALLNLSDAIMSLSIPTSYGKNIYNIYFVFPRETDKELTSDWRHGNVWFRSIHIDYLPQVVQNDVYNKTFFIFYDFFTWHHIVYSFYISSFQYINTDVSLLAGFLLTQGNGNNSLNHVINHRLIKLNIFIMCIAYIMKNKLEDVFYINDLDKKLLRSKLSLKKKEMVDYYGNLVGSKILIPRNEKSITILNNVYRFKKSIAVKKKIKAIKKRFSLRLLPLV